MAAEAAGYGYPVNDIERVLADPGNAESVLWRAHAAAQRLREAAPKGETAARADLAPEERYERNERFRLLTDYLVAQARFAKLTPGELRAAAALAAARCQPEAAPADVPVIAHAAGRPAGAAAALQPPEARSELAHPTGGMSYQEYAALNARDPRPGWWDYYWGID